ncbi:MAG: hypothetical protein U1F11_11670 [Steroidobacteraceae bacterium]
MYSLTRRLLVYVSLAFVLSFGVAALALDALFRDLAERSLRELLDAQMVALIAAAETDEAGRVRGASTEAEARLRSPGSGLYAEILVQGNGLLWRSPSVVGTFVSLAGNLPATAARASAMHDCPRAAASPWPSAASAGSTAAAVARRSWCSRSRPAWIRTRPSCGASARSCSAGLIVLTVLLLATLAVLLRRVMSPVQRLEAEISAVESGRLEALGESYPRELAGVAANLNALLASERERIRRYRDTLGNLAHSLKTPLSIVRDAVGGGALPGATGTTVVRELDRMGGIIEHQLRRAATSGGATLGQAPLELRPLLAELRVTLGKVHARKDLAIELDVAAGLCVFGDRADLLEALGNVLDNACKWCRGRVRVSAAALPSAGRTPAGAGRHRGRWPGFPPELRASGPARGRRADEHTPGHGIGLAMVAETVELYGGALRLGVGALGGGRVELQLPGRADGAATP